MTFLLNASSHYGEIDRAGIRGAPRGQSQAARSTGLAAGQTFVCVAPPRGVRNAPPELLSNTIERIKLTTSASVISAPELPRSADLARSLTYDSSPLVMAAAIHLVLPWPLVRWVRRMERRLAS